MNSLDTYNFNYVIRYYTVPQKSSIKNITSAKFMNNYDSTRSYDLFVRVKILLISSVDQKKPYLRPIRKENPDISTTHFTGGPITCFFRFNSEEM